MRILARRDDSEVLIVHGDDRAADVEAGERLAWVEWLPSIDVAEAMSRHCSGKLLEARFHPDTEGWHKFSVEHLPTLIRLAKNNLNVTFFPPPIKTPPQHQAWTKERVARLGFLAGQGWTAKAIAEDPLIVSTEGAVYRAAHRFGISLAEVPPGQVPIRLPAGVAAYFQRAAAREQCTRDALIRRLLIGLATPSEEAAA
ncbi:hypothetical protein [Beijerinckia sp. L45]|uniref:hypothetical protein n=1 Tax=Beijerinckia sp. L45 TaxID=1641855 RepID=UPI001FEEA3E1|nr:hypothetical protein [Beijerinckia sp. L45]